MMTAQVSMVVALLIVASVATASAECAWVLWSQAWSNVAGESRDWSPVTGRKTVWDCERERAATAKQVVATGLFQPDGGVLVMTPPQGGGLDFKALVSAGVLDPKTAAEWGRQDREFRERRDYLAFTCLPDTVDPRGPKGK